MMVATSETPQGDPAAALGLLAGVLAQLHTGIQVGLFERIRAEARKLAEFFSFFEAHAAMLNKTLVGFV